MKLASRIKPAWKLEAFVPIAAAKRQHMLRTCACTYPVTVCAGGLLPIRSTKTPYRGWLARTAGYTGGEGASEEAWLILIDYT